MGLGLLGRGVGDARFLAEQGADLIVTDIKTEEQLQSSIDQLKQYSNITFKLGGHDFADFRGRDLIVKGADIPLRNVYIEEARKWQVPITMSTALAAKLAPAIVVGVTGTKGKSTVTHLIYHILSQYSDRVFLGGNVRGVSTLEMLPRIRPGDILVLELDSWQLQGFGYEKISPHISVFTNLMPDHMNYYNDDMELYFNDKAQIFRNQGPKDHLIIHDSLLSKVGDIASTVHLPASMWKHRIPEIEMLPGEHNKLNIAYAMKAAQLLGLPNDKIEQAVLTFPGVPGRLQKIREYNGISFYNDNNATLPDATIAGIEALAQKGEVILIAGGNFKSIDPKPLAHVMDEKVKGAVLIPGTGTDELLKHTFHIPVKCVQTLDEAVTVAFANAKAGDSILFSPAFSSFGLYNNEYERSDHFDQLIAALV